MVYKQTIQITKNEEKYVTKYLTVEQKNEEECLPVGCHFLRTADFGNGYEMDIKLCGVDYEEGGCNTAWAEAVLFHNGCEVACSDTDEDYMGYWELEHKGNTFITVVESV